MSYVDRAGHGTGRLQTDHLKHHPVLVPPPSHQQAVCAVLGAADAEVQLLNERLAALRVQKRALADKLLSGEIRVLAPEES